MTDKSCNGLRVLLIAPRFFGYELEILAELTRQGMHVDMLPDRPFENPLMKSLMRFMPEFGAYQACDNYFDVKIKDLSTEDYALILVIQGEGVTTRTLTNMRAKFPKARIHFYAWDSIENKPYSKRNLTHYDLCLTFDPLDAKKYGMQYRPLFFSHGFDCATDDEHAYDLSFVGTIHSDRYHIVKKIVEQLAPDMKAFVYLYLQAPWMYDLRRLFSRTIVGAKREEFRFVPLSKSFVQETFFASRAILDIEHPSQRGATMRTFETIGSNRKLITTNSTLKNYDFYRPCNIHIIEREKPKLNLEFLKTPYEQLPDSIRAMYSLQQWVRDVCGL